jgi:hypothetical protein
VGGTTWSSLLVPALLAGLVAVLVTVAIERFGGIVGGFLGTLPSTIVPAAWGMYATLPEDAFVEAMSTVPPGMLVNALFLWLWRALPPHVERRMPDASLAAQLAVMGLLTLTGWAVGAFVVVVATNLALVGGAPPLALGTAALASLVGMGIAACWTGVPAPRGRNRVGPVALAARGTLAASAILASLVIAAFGSPLLAGIASVFPAIFVTAMVSIWWSQGKAVTGGAVGPMMLGSGAVGAYALFAAVLYPALGPELGTLGAWLGAALLLTLPATLWMRARRAS